MKEIQRQTKPKTAQMVILNGDSLNANFSRFVERLKVFWIPHMSGYLMKPIIIIIKFFNVVLARRDEFDNKDME